MTDRSVVFRLRAEVTQFRAQMAQAGASTKKLADDLTALDKNGAKMRGGLTQLGGTAGRFGLVAAAGLGAAIASAANFDQAMSNVQAATHETADNMDRLREAALQAGADTAFSASEAAAGIENLAKAGVSTSDILSGGLTGALDLAAAGNLDVATAAEAAATAMTQFGLSGEQVPHIADLLAAGAGKAQGEVTDLSMALNQSGLVAAQMGLSIEETTGTLSAFASAGLLGSDAGTSLKTALLRLANPSKESAQLMKELGINAYDANGNLVSMSDLAGQLGTAFEGQTQAQRDAALATIFGSDAIRAANVLYSQGSEGIADWTNKVNDSGYAAETAATRLDNLKGDLEALKGSLETALIGSGEGGQGPLRSLTQNLTKAVNAFNDLPPAAQSTTTALLGVTAVTGGAAWFGSKVIGGIANTKQALFDLGWTAEQTAKSLKLVSAGLNVVAIVGALSAVDAAFNSLDDRISDADLQRNLDAFAGGASVENLDSLGASVRSLNSGVDRTFDLVGNALTLTVDTSTWEKAQEDVEKVDQALAGLVESGQADQAAQIFARINDQATDLGVSADDVAGSFDSYGTALRNANGVSGSWISRALEGASTEQHLGQAIDQATGNIDRQTASLADNVAAMAKKREAALGAFDAETQWRNALVDARKAAAANSAGIEGNTEAALDNRAKLSALAGAWNNQSKAVQNTEGRFKAARTAFINTAIGMGVSEEAARQLARKLMELPKSKTIPVTVETSSAMSKLYELNRLKLDDKYIYVHTVRLGGDGTDFVSGGQHKAMGGLITGPGTATSDSVPVWASNREYMIKADTVDHYGVAFFDAINAQRFAQGGLIGGGSTAASAPLRLDVGDLHVTGTLQSDLGPVKIRGIARAEAVDVVNRHQRAERVFQRGHERGYGGLDPA